MKYFNFDIVFQEIPDEVTLAVNITNCPNHCDQCHSPHLQTDIGDLLTPETIDMLLKRYGPLITCFCFMGGDSDVPELERLARHIRDNHDLKIGWYSGRNTMPPHPKLFDYVKLGPYLPDKGGLKSPATNQRLFRRNGDVWEDITERFWSR